MQNKNIIILFLLILVLISNTFVLFKINEVKEELMYLKDNVSSIKFDVRNSVNNVRNMVNDINEQTRWITPVKVSLGEKRGNKQIVNLSWQVRDYTQNSQVNFYLRPGANNTFQKIPVENTGGSTFAVDIETLLDLEPEFTIITEHPSTSSQNETIGIEEKSSTASLVHEYYVEVREGKNIKSSEPATLNLGNKLRSREFAPIKLAIAYLSETKYSLTVFEEERGDNSNKLTKVSVNGIDDIGNSFNKELTKQDKAIFTTTIELGENTPQKIKLLLKYDTGKTISKELSL